MDPDVSDWVVIGNMGPVSEGQRRGEQTHGYVSCVVSQSPLDLDINTEIKSQKVGFIQSDSDFV